MRTEKLLNQYIDYLLASDADGISTATALSWANLPQKSDGSWRNYRLSVVRTFARYLSISDAAVEVPPMGLLPYCPPRATPYLYSASEITALMGAASILSCPQRQVTMATLVGLLAATGMRVGEAIRLDMTDIDQSRQLLRVRDTKFGKSREVLLHPTAVTALEKYRADRARWQPRSDCPALFLSLAGTRLLYCNVHHAFRRMVTEAGLSARSHKCQPRIHDLRHSFTVASMLDAYAAGGDGQAQLALISTYLGHTDPAATYWYLSAAPELMAAAAQRLTAYEERS
ncbi:tyrosine-type recombinase/integrase [Paeniglutamicibacter cryotolerans]|uniref:Integrase n=1 Tax=Paeniglutamicibacter cryotolerans TaxID=670079 RepID=A0A839QXU1_9MICC|nr:tyrosine-type recombinase/integrase [Paeniglutamicibacter cryotolerans]MBB2996781.1 integrase [Paeniglutamicibacter cryotolerans]